jgi:Uma2 family endonuclease
MATRRSAPKATTMSWEQFLDWMDEDTLAEWVDGEVVVTSPANRDHEGLFGFLLALLRAYVEVHQLGEVLGSRFFTRLPRSGREPDLMFVATAHLDRLTPTYLDGPPDLVVEIISPESEQRDRVEKRHEYEQAGIPEYWLLDPARREATFLLLGADGRYAPASATGGVYRSRILPGFQLPLDWLWTPPPLLEALHHLGLTN